MNQTRIFSALFLVAVLSLGSSGAFGAAGETDASTEITRQLNDFLKYNTEAHQHASFWADDLIYTSAAGSVKHKEEIMSGFKTRKSSSPTKREAPSVYSGEDIKVRQYGDSAALTFRLVARKPDGTRLTYRNSGMFVRRDNRWQAVTWQATKEPGN